MLITTLPITMAETDADDFRYKISNDAVTILGYSGQETDLIIPETIEGYPVTRIASWAFEWRGVVSVILPDSITSISSNAFHYCTDLVSITIPDGVTFIGEQAFMGCYNLPSITFPDSLTYVGKEAFYDCTNLKEVTLGSNISDIGYQAFGYEWRYPNDDIRKENFIIRGYTGSVAEAYTKQNEFTFISLGKMDVPAYTYGDVTGDEKIDASDALFTLKIAVRSQYPTLLQFAAAEVSGDNKLDAIDALLVLQFAVEKIDKFPVQK
jgi:hypothetical protein